MTVAAMPGQTPNTPVRLVPAARTATVSLALVSRICAPVPRRSAVNWTASSRRATATASEVVIDPSSWRQLMSNSLPSGSFIAIA